MQARASSSIIPSGSMTKATWSGQEPAVRLVTARRALFGHDERGVKTGVGMFDDGVISFAHGEGIRRPHESVVAAAIKWLMQPGAVSLEHYLFLNQNQAFDDAVARYCAAVTGVLFRQEEICVDAGTTRLFQSFLMSHLDPGDLVITGQGYYHALAGWCDVSGRQLRIVKTQRVNSHKLTAADLREWGAERRNESASSGVLVIFNPTYLGAVYSRDELIDIAAWLEEHDLPCIEDAVFAGTEFPGRMPTVHLASVVRPRSKVLTFLGVSKAFGLANCRIGWACGNADLIERMSVFSKTFSPTVPEIAKVMVAAALSAPEAYLAVNAAECALRSQLLLQCVQRFNAYVNGCPGGKNIEALTVSFEPCAGHSMLVSFEGLCRYLSSLGLPTSGILEMTSLLLDKAGVAISPGSSMGFDGAEARLTFGCVGAEHTHDSSRAAELRALRTLGFLEVGPGSETNHSQGFEYGRQCMEEAFFRRLPHMVESILAG